MLRATVWPVLAFLLLAISTPQAHAQAGLPPEARAQVLILDIDKAIGRKDFTGALGKMRELDGIGVARPPALYITEAKLAGQNKDYPRARAALEKYFKAANTSDANYKEAVSIYSAIGDLEQSANASVWSSVQSRNTCEAYAEYLTSSSGKPHEAEALKAGESLNCGFNIVNLQPSILTPREGALVGQSAGDLLDTTWTPVAGAVKYEMESSVSEAPTDAGLGGILSRVSGVQPTPQRTQTLNGASTSMREILVADGSTKSIRVTAINKYGMRSKPSAWRTFKIRNCFGYFAPGSYTMTTDAGCKR